MTAESSSVNWPVRHNVFGVQVSATHYDQVVETVMRAAEAGDRGLVDFMPAHLLTAVAGDADFRRRMDDFDLVAPDGQPVRWALNFFHGAALKDRVYGPETTRRLCAAA